MLMITRCKHPVYKWFHMLTSVCMWFYV